MSNKDLSTTSNHKASESSPWWKSIFQDYLIPCVVGFVVAWFVTTYIFFTAFVPSGSMEPTIDTGEKMLVSYLYNTDKLEHGDIVVFESKEFDKFFVKRLIGKGGDTIELLADGSVVRNGEILDEPYVINAVTYQTPQSFIVPEGTLFFLGDNRMNSHDARYWENPFISEDDVLGRPFLTISPIKNIRFL